MSSVACSSCVPVEIAASLQKKQMDQQGEVAKTLIQSAEPTAPRPDVAGKKLLASA